MYFTIRFLVHDSRRFIYKDGDRRDILGHTRKGVQRSSNGTMEEPEKEGEDKKSRMKD